MQKHHPVSGHPGKREISRFNYPLNYASEIDVFRKSFSYTSQSWSIALEDTSLDIELHLKKARPKVLVVFLGGAKISQDYGKVGPFFLGRSMSKSLEANLLFISDPTFAYDEQIKLGWYLGTRKSNAQRATNYLIECVRDLLQADFIIFFGGSGGGFASLYHSAHFPGSLACIWNPQINILKYHHSIVEETTRLAFGCNKNELDKFVSTDVTSFYTESKPLNKVLLWQNFTDHHVTDHLNPFLEARGIPLKDKCCSEWLTDDFFLHLNNVCKNHTPPPKEFILKLLYKISLEPGYLSNEEYSSLFSV